MSDFLPAADEVHEISAPAKTNLWLRILGKRADGFHEIETRMVLLELADRIRLGGHSPGFEAAGWEVWVDILSQADLVDDSLVVEDAFYTP